jgi:outer membrane receptor protein involved in Fe transport
MNPRIYLLWICLFGMGATVSAQNTGNISGQVNGNGQALENASITLHLQRDSSLVKAAVSNKEGHFSFDQIRLGKYLVRVQMVGFRALYSEAIDLSSANNNANLGILHLQTAAQSLGEVTVNSRRPFLEMKADKMVVNVDASPSNAGNTALEVLEKAPGVTVDRDGNISLKGKQGVTVLIDGRQTYMSGEDLANYLRGMNANQLDQVEVMTNPPARFDASGNSGVINIRTKKNKVRGFNGNVNVNYGQGVYAKTSAGTNLNYRVNKLNIFGNYNYSYREAYQQFNILRHFINPHTKVITGTFDQQANLPDSRDMHSGKIGIDYTFSSRTTAALTFNAANNKLAFNSASKSVLTDGNGSLQSITYAMSRMRPAVSNISSNFNLRHQFDSAGRELSFDADFIRFKNKHKQQFDNYLTDGSGNPMGKADSLTGYLPSGFDVYAAKIDYTHPLSGKAKLETGAKISIVDSDNDVRFDSIINGNRVPDLNRSNHFLYKENVYAGYINFNTPLSGKWSLQAGLRYEYTRATGNQLTTGQSFENKYGKLFPTLYLSYEMDENNQFSANFGRRITRPQYRNLNPFIFILDRYTFQKGNPGLQPQFSNNIELSHTFRKFLTTTINYSETNGVLAEVIEQNETTRETYLIPRNIASRKQYGIMFNIYKPLNKWLTVIGNINLYNNRFKGIITDSLVDISSNTGNFYASVQGKFGKGWDAEINGFYNTGGVEGVTVTKSMGSINFAISKNVLKNQGKITLNYRDPFKLQYFRGVTRYATVDATMNNRWENSILNITFNYRFGKAFKTNKRSSGSAAEEQSRIGG